MEKIILAFELIGTVSFSVSGAISAIRKKFDIFGILFCAIIAALGGGVFRDTLLGVLPPTMFTDYIYVFVAAAAAVVTFIAAQCLNRTKLQLAENSAVTFVNYTLDAVGLAVFTIVGINIAMSRGFSDNAFFVIFLGTASGCGGGIFRDVLIREIPLIFSKRIYAVASVLGGTVYWLLLNYGILNDTLSMLCGMAVIFVVRLLAIIFRWNLPHAS